MVAPDAGNAICGIRSRLCHINRQRAVIADGGLMRRVGHNAVVGSPLTLDRDVGRAEVREVAARQIGGVGRTKEVDAGGMSVLRRQSWIRFHIDRQRAVFTIDECHAFSGSGFLAIESERNALRSVEIQNARIVNAVERHQIARIERARILEVVNIHIPTRQILASDRERTGVFERAGLEFGLHGAHSILAGELHRAAVKGGAVAKNGTYAHRPIRLNRAVVADHGILAVDGQDVGQSHVLGRNVDLDRARGRVVDYGIRSEQETMHGSEVVRFMVERDVERAGVAEGRTTEHLDGVVVGGLLVPCGPQVNRDDARFGVVKDTLVSHTNAEHVARRDNVPRATTCDVDPTGVLELGALARRHDCAHFGVRSSTRHAVEVKRHVARIGNIGLCARVQTVGIALFRRAARHVHRKRAGVGGTA